MIGKSDGSIEIFLGTTFKNFMVNLFPGEEILEGRSAYFPTHNPAF